MRQVTSISKKPIVKFACGKRDETKAFFRGDYLYLEIDIQRPDDELQKEFLRIIKECKSKLTPGRKIASNIKGDNFDIWDIYDDKHRDPPRNTQEIIIDIHGKKYDVDKYQKRYEKEIERAANKAEKIINFVKEKVPLLT